MPPIHLPPDVVSHLGLIAIAAIQVTGQIVSTVMKRLERKELDKRTAEAKRDRELIAEQQREAAEQQRLGQIKVSEELKQTQERLIASQKEAAEALAKLTELRNTAVERMLGSLHEELKVNTAKTEQVGADANKAYSEANGINEKIHRLAANDISSVRQALLGELIGLEHVDRPAKPERVQKVEIVQPEGHPVPVSEVDHPSVQQVGRNSKEQ